MIRRFALFLALFALSLVIRAPSWLIDQAVSRATSGEIRLALIEGTLWNGRGTLTAVDPVSLRAQPWVTLQWRWLPGSLLRGEAAWQLTADDKQAGEVGAGVRGWRADGVSLAAPARFAMERIPHAFGRLGWRGDMQFETTQWRCSWKMRCEGRAGLRWSGAAVDVLRGRPLGDYQIDLRGESERLAIAWLTLRGETQINAQGQIEGGHGHFEGTVRGDPAFLQRLPSVAGNWVQPGATPGEYRFRVQN
ncbi:type II secretion system protein N [Niveibacterium sp.]|uniref:type II secretion system protein N n=1 Tax=Niveibacterium sp. TaxID=2017444 RepID=UPI0035B3C2D1